MNYFSVILNQYKLIFSLAVLDFRETYSGSYLGVVWAILRALIFISVIWVLFSAGMKKSLIKSETPFILYLLVGFAPWTFFSNALSGLTNTFRGNKTLVKRPDFPIIILPVVNILSAFILHLIFLVIVILILIFMRHYPSLYWLQLPYYVVMLSFLLFGFGLLIGSLGVFTNDIAQFVGAVLQVGFWVTPIFWSLNIVPDRYLWLLNFNPVVYIVHGYRNVFLNHVWFWEDTQFLVSFLIMVIFFIIIGLFAYKKLRPHFGDVL